MHANSVLGYVAIACLCEVDSCALGKQSWFSSEYGDGMSIIFKGVALFKRVFQDQTEECRDGGDEICPIHCMKYKSRGMTKIPSKTAW